MKTEKTPHGVAEITVPILVNDACRAAFESGKWIYRVTGDFWIYRRVILKYGPCTMNRFGWTYKSPWKRFCRMEDVTVEKVIERLMKKIDRQDAHLELLDLSHAQETHVSTPLKCNNA